MNEYFNTLNTPLEENLQEKFDKLRKYALENNVPILKLDSINLLKFIIKTSDIKNILEIGTAIGYSSLSFVTAKEGVTCDTFERDLKMIELAEANIKSFNCNDRINIIQGDALEINLPQDKKYDLIFIDAAKAQYQKFFDKFEPYLSPNGYIVCDNLLFHGCLENRENISKNVLSMVKKIAAFNENLKNNPHYTTIFLDSGDGLSISRRKK